VVNADHDQERPGDVAQRFERDRNRRDGCLPPVRQQIPAQPLHQPGVIDFANRVFVRFAGVGSRSLLLGGCSGLVLCEFRHEQRDSVLFYCTGPALLPAMDAGTARFRGLRSALSLRAGHAISSSMWPRDFSASRKAAFDPSRRLIISAPSSVAMIVVAILQGSTLRRISRRRIPSCTIAARRVFQSSMASTTSLRNSGLPSSQSMAVEVNLEVVEVEEGMKGPTLCGTHGVESTSGRLSQNARTFSKCSMRCPILLISFG